MENKMSTRNNLINKLAEIYIDCASPDDEDTAYDIAESFVSDLQDSEIPEFFDPNTTVYFDPSTYDFLIETESNYY